MAVTMQTAHLVSWVIGDFFHSIISFTAPKFQNGMISYQVSLVKYGNADILHKKISLQMTNISINNNIKKKTMAAIITLLFKMDDVEQKLVIRT